MKQLNKLAIGTALAAGLLVQTAAAETTLRFTWWGGNPRHEATQKVIKLFEAQNPGVIIKGEPSPWSGYLERLTTQMTGGGEPDIIQLNWAWLPMFSHNGTGFYDLYKVKNVLKLDEWPNNTIKSGEIAGKLNAIPVSNTARFFLWNKTTLDKAGLKPPKTWDELMGMGKIIESKLGKDYYPMDGGIYEVILMSHAYIYQKTGKQYIDPKQPRVALTQAEAMEWVSFYKKLTDNHIVVPWKQRLTLGGEEKPVEQQPDWVNGKWGGVYHWDSTFTLRVSTPKNQEFILGDFLTMPGAKANGYFSRPTMMLAVSRNCKNPEIAAKLINFMMTDPKAIEILGAERGVPMANTGYKIVAGNGKTLGIQLKAQDILKKVKIETPSPLLEYSRIQSFIREIFEQVSFGKITEKEAADRLVNEGNQILKRMKM